MDYEISENAFVYCWTDHANQKLYVGVHKGSPDDGYISSGKLMLDEYKRRPGDFSRQIIAQGSWDDCIALETKILKAEDAGRNPNYYNMHNGNGQYYNKGHTQAAKEKMKAKRATQIITEEHKAKIGAAHKGMKRSIETRKKMSDAHKGKPNIVAGTVWINNGDKSKRWIGSIPNGWVKGRGSFNNVGMTGKKHSAETKAKIKVNTKKALNKDI